MTLRLKTILFDKRFALGVFILLHVLLFNINTAEWGDSYRMLRASQFIRVGAYPEDEKRPPLFPILLAARPAAVDPLVWGRGIMLVVSILYYLVFSALTETYLKDKRYLLLARFLFIFNPVILYWSLRVMSDIPMAFIALLSFYCLRIWAKKLDLGKSILIGFMCGLAVLMRFEGYLLAAAMAIGIVFANSEININLFKFKTLFNTVKNSFWNVFTYLIMFSLTILPYILYRNPFNSSYFSEPSGRAYDIKMVWTYFISVAFLFGFVPALFVVITKFKSFMSFFSKNIGVLTFLILELILILLWPAALPRLFVSIIPFLIIPLVIVISSYTQEKQFNKLVFFILNLSVLAFFAVSQYFLKLQFLVPSKISFVIVLLIQMLVVLSFYKRSYVLTSIAVFISVAFWSFSTIWLHKNIYSAIKQAADYTYDNLSGTVAFNDSTSVFDWYVNNRAPKSDLKAFYYKGGVEGSTLRREHIDYLVVTNEDNIAVRYKVNENSGLTLIKDFRYNISRKEFFAKIYKVDEGK